MTFHNIFSKKKAKEPKNKEIIKIIVDNRERNSLVPSELINLGFDVEFQQIEVGDYIVNNIIIERKTISDLKSSIINKRIFQQIKNMQDKQAIIIIEGFLEEDIYQGLIHENALRGFLLSLALDFKIPFILTQNSKDTAKYISILARKKEKSEPPIRASRILETEEEQIQFILEGFPHIGPAKAKKLISRFKSIKNIINAKEEELKEILGNMAKEFRELLEKEVNL